METTTITLANIDEADRIYRLYRSCTAEMLANGIIQWHDDYPKRQDAISDIEDGAMYCLRANELILGVVTFNEKQDAQYKFVDWKFKEGRVGVVHRLAIDPKFQEFGHARTLMDFVRDLAIDGGYDLIRLDAFSRNPRILNFYRNRGYHQCGEVFFEPLEEPFYCFEKKLSKT